MAAGGYGIEQHMEDVKQQTETSASGRTDLGRGAGRGRGQLEERGRGGAHGGSVFRRWLPGCPYLNRQLRSRNFSTPSST